MVVVVVVVVARFVLRVGDGWASDGHETQFSTLTLRISALAFARTENSTLYRAIASCEFMSMTRYRYGSRPLSLVLP